MTGFAVAALFVVFVWWFSTGAILLLVARAARARGTMQVAAAGLFIASLAGIAASSSDATPASAYCAFTFAIVAWGAVELSLLAGWITGPRPAPCPATSGEAERASFALQAIAYHELALVTAGALVFAVGGSATNPVAWWTFAALFLLRQSAKLNLFLGVRTLNDDLMPAQVAFLRSYFASKPLNALLPVSLSASISVAVALVVSALSAISAYDQAAFALLAVLVALGALEHVFMLLPMSVTDLWRWAGGHPPATDEPKPAVPTHSVPAPAPVLVQAAPSSSPVAVMSARQRLDEQFRQAYRAERAREKERAEADLLAGLAMQQSLLATRAVAEGRAP